jgi:hypothetical protein
VQCPPDGVSRLGGHELLTNQGNPYSKSLIQGNLQQLYTERILVIRPSLALYTTRNRNALNDLSVSFNLMSKAMFERLGYPALTPTSRTVQLADASIQYPKGIVESLLVSVQGSCIFVDFVVLDMQYDA